MTVPVWLLPQQSHLLTCVHAQILLRLHYGFTAALKMPANRRTLLHRRIPSETSLQSVSPQQRQWMYCAGLISLQVSPKTPHMRWHLEGQTTSDTEYEHAHWYKLTRNRDGHIWKRKSATHNFPPPQVGSWKAQPSWRHNMKSPLSTRPACSSMPT